jgi:hypothetical protein
LLGEALRDASVWLQAQGGVGIFVESASAIIALLD